MEPFCYRTSLIGVIFRPYVAADYVTELHSFLFCCRTCCQTFVN